MTPMSGRWASPFRTRQTPVDRAHPVRHRPKLMLRCHKQCEVDHTHADFCLRQCLPADTPPPCKAAARCVLSEDGGRQRGRGAGGRHAGRMLTIMRYSLSRVELAECACFWLFSAVGLTNTKNSRYGKMAMFASAAFIGGLQYP
jgi:hypothetical protein